MTSGHIAQRRAFPLHTSRTRQKPIPRFQHCRPDRGAREDCRVATYLAKAASVPAGDGENARTDAGPFKAELS